MRRLTSRISPVYVLFVVLTVLQSAILRVTGVTSDVSLVRLIPAVALLAMLGRRSRVAWWLLVALDAVPLLSTTFMLGPHVLWGHVALLAGSSLLLLALLASHPMRAYVATGRPAGGGRPVGRALG